ncbi:MAG: glycosyltransferase, partial [Nanoarchaeota archaeon]
MTVSLVIPNWNGRHLIERNISSWLAVGASEVIVVDDGSTDGSVVLLHDLRFKNKDLRIIENKKNLGFARAVNRGVEASRGDIVVLLNTDVRPEPGLLDVVLPHFKNKNVFGVSFNEVRWSWGKGRWLNGFFEHGPGPQTKETHITFWISGGSGVFRKSIWDALGGFDTIYHPFYWEDIDLSYRAAKRGYTLLWATKARVDHEHEG